MSPNVQAPDWRMGGAPHLATKFSPGVPPYFPLKKKRARSLLICSPSPPPMFPQACMGGLFHSNTYGKTFSRGYPLFSLVKFLNNPARLRLTSGWMHLWVCPRRWRWRGGGVFGSTGLWEVPCPSLGIPMRLPKAAWQGGVIQGLQRRAHWRCI